MLSRTPRSAAHCAYSPHRQPASPCSQGGPLASTASDSGPAAWALPASTWPQTPRSQARGQSAGAGGTGIDLGTPGTVGQLPYPGVSTSVSDPVATTVGPYLTMPGPDTTTASMWRACPDWAPLGTLVGLCPHPSMRPIATYPVPLRACAHDCADCAPGESSHKWQLMSPMRVALWPGVASMAPRTSYRISAWLRPSAPDGHGGT